MLLHPAHATRLKHLHLSPHLQFCRPSPHLSLSRCRRRFCLDFWPKPLVVWCGACVEPGAVEGCAEGAEGEAWGGYEVRAAAAAASAVVAYALHLPRRFVGRLDDAIVADERRTKSMT